MAKGPIVVRAIKEQERYNGSRWLLATSSAVRDVATSRVRARGVSKGDAAVRRVA